MNRPFLLPRILALWLSLCLALPMVSDTEAVSDTVLSSTHLRSQSHSESSGLEELKEALEEKKETNPNRWIPTTLALLVLGSALPILAEEGGKAAPPQPSAVAQPVAPEEALSENDPSRGKDAFRFSDEWLQNLFKEAPRLPQRPNLPKDRPPTRVVPIAGKGGAKACVFEVNHGDGDSLGPLKDFLDGFGDQPFHPKEWLFVIEGGAKVKSEGVFRPDANDLAVKIAQRFGISIVNPVRNIAHWEVIEGILEQARKADPPVSRQEVLGAWVVWGAHGLSSVPLDVAGLVEYFHGVWKTHVTLDELYEAINLYLDEKGKELYRKRFGQMLSLLKQMDEESGNRVELSQWETMEKVLDEVSRFKPPLSRKELLGFIMIAFAPKELRGDFLDIFGSIRKFLNIGWKDHTDLEELHRATVSFQGGEDAYREAAIKRVKKWRDATQDHLTLDALQGVLAKFPGVKYILAIAGWSHSRALQEGIKTHFSGQAAPGTKEVPTPPAPAAAPGTEGAGLEEKAAPERVSRGRLVERFGEAAVPLKEARGAWLVPAREGATDIHLHIVHETVASAVARQIQEQIQTLPPGLRVHTHLLRTDKGIPLETPGVAIKDALLDLPDFWKEILRQILPVLEVQLGEPVPALAEMVLYALQGSGGSMEKILGVMRLEDSRGRAVYAFFV